jgi:hypothetical protein
MKKIAVILFIIYILLFPTQINAWWDANYSHRFKYVIDNSQVGDILLGYPILINLSQDIPDEFWDNIQSTGYDIRIVDQDDATNLTPYSHLEGFNYASVKGNIWVKKNILPTGNTNYVWIYYGYESAANPFSGTTKQNTYNSDFAMVQHFEESSGDFLDETANGIDGSLTGMSRITNALISAGADSDSDSDYITLADILDETSPPFAYSFWVFPKNVTDATQAIYSNGSDNPLLKLEEDDIVFEYNSTANGTVDCRASDIMSDSEWQNIGVIVYANSDLKIYRNGSEQSTSGYCDAIDPIQDTANGIISADSTPAFNGYFDEFRVFDALVSPEWLEYTYKNDRSSGGTAGQEQPFYVQSLDASLEAYLSSDWSTDIASTVLEGVYNVGVKNDSYRIASFAVDFADSYDWSSLSADTDADNHKAYFHYPGGYSSLPGASGASFTLYIPKGNTYKVRICPNADSLASITSGCVGQYFFDLYDDNVEFATEVLVEYW